MVRVAWMTDIHLNFLSSLELEKWLKEMAQVEFDVLLVTGDVGEAENFASYLVRMAGRFSRPLYFILGNHDYYRSSIARVRSIAASLPEKHSLIKWLPQQGIVRLSEQSALVGHGGWADGGYGDFMRSSIVLNDYALIDELTSANMIPSKLLPILQALGQEAAAHLEATLPRTLDQYAQVYVALHAPPFQESCWHEGRTPDDDDPYLPHFTCKQAGDVLLKLADAYPHRQITVLCGHTHGSGEAQPRPNLHVITAGAEYGAPRIDRIIDM